MATIAKKTQSGTFEVFRDGKRISTTSASGLKAFGLSESNLGTTPTPTPTPTPTLTPTIQKATKTEISNIGEGGIVTRGSQKFRINPAGELLQITPEEKLSAKDRAAVRAAGIKGGLSKEVSTSISLGKLPTVIDASVSTTTKTPQFEKPQTEGIQDSFTTSVQNTVDTSRKILDDRLATEIADIDKKVEDTNKNIEELTTLETEGIEDVGELMQPFRATLEEAERERLFVNKNFRENQILVDELGSLLSEGNELIRQQKEITGLSSIRNPRIDKTISDVNSRAGVIQAVLNARNGQINQAFTMIDRTVDAINADKQDQLTYYSTLLNFFDKEKDSEGKKLVTLNKDKKDFLQSQIGLLEGDLERAEENADNIKDLITDPETASLMARAGVTLNDSTEEVADKIATQTEFEKNQFTSTTVDGVKIITDPSGKVVSTTKPTTKDGIDEPFGTKDLPGSVRQEIIDDLTNAEFAKTSGEITLQQLATIYPDVQLETLQDLMDRFYDFDSLIEGTEAEEPGFVGKIVKSIGGFFSRE